MDTRDIRKLLRASASQKKARILSSFFKTGSGQYGEGDVFLGVTVPKIRVIARRCGDVSLRDITRLLRSSIHEERMLALILLISRYKRATACEKETIYNLYLDNVQYVNSWDLVDVSAPHIIGDFLWTKDRAVLYRYAHSSSLWQRRIALIATFHFIRAGQFCDTIAIAKLLLRDKEDLIHKAAGWMLREVGKRNRKLLKEFLKTYYKQMPRTMLRYSIEKFPYVLRRKYLSAKVSYIRRKEMYV